MRYLPALLIPLLLSLPPAQADTAQKPVAAASACGSGTNAPCAPVPAVISVSIQADAAQVSQQIAKASDEKPYEGWYARNAWMRWMVWYCAIMFPVAIVGLTIGAVLQARKKRFD